MHGLSVFINSFSYLLCIPPLLFAWPPFEEILLYGLFAFSDLLRLKTGWDFFGDYIGFGRFQVGWVGKALAWFALCFMFLFLLLFVILRLFLLPSPFIIVCMCFCFFAFVRF